VNRCRPPPHAGSLDSTIAWFAALQGIALVAFVGSVGIYVVLWLDERRSG
jgi:hypothetical protein